MSLNKERQLLAAGYTIQYIGGFWFATDTMSPEPCWEVSCREISEAIEEAYAHMTGMHHD